MCSAYECVVVIVVHVLFFSISVFFLKQKTAYEMRISDWSSDVCSSDLAFLAPDAVRLGGLAGFVGRQRHRQLVLALEFVVAGDAVARTADHHGAQLEIGRESCRARVGQYV